MLKLILGRLKTKGLIYIGVGLLLLVTATYYYQKHRISSLKSAVQTAKTQNQIKDIALGFQEGAINYYKDTMKSSILSQRLVSGALTKNNNEEKKANKELDNYNKGGSLEKKINAGDEDVQPYINNTIINIMLKFEKETSGSYSNTGVE